jgi:hypothetical protein
MRTLTNIVLIMVFERKSRSAYQNASKLISKCLQNEDSDFESSDEWDELFEPQESILTPLFELVRLRSGTDMVLFRFFWSPNIFIYFIAAHSEQ